MDNPTNKKLNMGLRKAALFIYNLKLDFVINYKSKFSNKIKDIIILNVWLAFT